MKTSFTNLKAAACPAVLLILSVIYAPVAAAQSDAGWQKKWEEVRAKAKAEGKVVVLGPPGDQIRDAITKSFAKAFPDISIEFSGARGGELATRIKAERDAGIYSADILINGTSTANAYFKPMNALDPVEPALILPEVIDPKNWRDNRLEFSDRSTRLDLVITTQTNVPLIYDPRTNMHQLEKRGLKFGVMVAFKDYGAYLTPGFGSLMVMNKSPHPNAGKVFLNWLLTKEGQTAFSKGMGYMSRRLDVPTDHVPSYWVPKEGVKYWAGYYEEDATMTPEQVKFLKSIFGR
jgi:ABC-type Fe3+ transport system substrate-binding protein